MRGGAPSVDALAPTDVPGLVTLARSARERDLLEEADLFAWHALVLDPRSEAAHQLLGHVRRGEAWGFTEGTRRIAFDDRDAAHADFGSAWRFAAPHWSVRTNLPLANATTIALDLENAYQAFFAEFGRDLELRELLAPIGADVGCRSSSVTWWPSRPSAIAAASPPIPPPTTRTFTAPPGGRPAAARPRASPAGAGDRAGRAARRPAARSTGRRTS